VIARLALELSVVPDERDAGGGHRVASTETTTTPTTPSHVDSGSAVRRVRIGLVWGCVTC